MNSQFPWMEHVCYEPAPIPRRQSRFRWFYTLAALAIISGALVALNQLRG